MSSTELSIPIEELTLLDLLALMLNRALSPDDPLFVTCLTELNRRFNLSAIYQSESDTHDWLLVEEELPEELEEPTEPTEEDWEEADRNYDHDQEATERSGWIDSRRLLEQEISNESQSGPEAPSALSVTVIEPAAATIAPAEPDGEPIPEPEVPLVLPPSEAVSAPAATPPIQAKSKPPVQEPLF